MSPDVVKMGTLSPIPSSSMATPKRPSTPNRPPVLVIRSHKYEKWIEYKRTPNEARAYYKRKLEKIVNELETLKGPICLMIRNLGSTPPSLRYGELAVHTMNEQLKHRKGIIECSHVILPLFSLASTQHADDVRELRNRPDLMGHVQMHLNTWRRKNEHLPWVENIQRMRAQKNLLSPSRTTTETKKMEQTLKILQELVQHSVVFKNSSTIYTNELFGRITGYHSSEVEEQESQEKDSSAKNATNYVEILAQNALSMSISSESDVETDYEDNFDESYFDLL